LSGAFGSLVSEAVRLGVPDVGELISEKIGAANFERLRATLGEDLKAQLDASAQAGQQWGATFEAEMRGYLTNAAEVGARTDELNQKWGQLQQRFTEELAARLDVSQPLSAIDQMRARLDMIPDITHKQIIFDVYYAMSPQRPFSEFLPRVQSMFGNLQSLVGRGTPDILFNVPNLNGQLGNIASLRNQYTAIANQQVHPRDAFTPGVAAYDAYLRDQALSRVRGQIYTAQSNLDLDIARAQQTQSSSGGSGAGSGGGATVNIDLRGSSMSREFLDDELIPALERGIIRATGRDPKMRILN
jgi:hypothetical protein